MFMLNNKPLALDVPFEHEGVNYPANWLRLATAEEKLAIGISEVADEPVVDLRFYWGPNNPKDLEVLKLEWISKAKEMANQKLSESDWMVIREMDAGIHVPAAVKSDRAAIRQLSSDKEAAINAFTSVEELEAYINGGGFFS